MSAPTWNKEFELYDGSYSVSDIQDYFRYILKKHETVSDNISTMMFVKLMENKITFKTRAGYYFEISMPETIKSLGSTKSKMKMVKMCLI